MFLAAKMSQQLWISIHTLHTEGDRPSALFPIAIQISIHTLHTEGDWSPHPPFPQSLISIHTLHTEGDLGIHKILPAPFFDFNPHPPHGG